MLKRRSAHTGPNVFTAFKANDDVVYTIRAWFSYDTALSGVV